MPISQYQQSIINARSIPLKKTRSAEERVDTALRSLFGRLEGLLNDSTRGDSVQRSLWRRKQAELADLINGLAIDLKRDLVTATTETADEIAQLRERETNDLLSENNFSTIVDFSAVPTQTLDLLAQRQDVEGLKVSANIWSDNQIEAINREVNVAIAGGDRQDTLTRLRAFVLGAEGFTAQELADLRRIRGTGRRRLGQSINAKAKRLLRTEIANAAWEAGRLSADQSPLVGGIQWNLSARHPHWDVCDVLATQDLYGLGKGVYPPVAIPPRPHPNDMCFMTDEIRPVEEWDQPKDVPELQLDPNDIQVQGEGTDHFIETQRQLAVDLISGSAGAAARGVPPTGTFLDAVKAEIAKGLNTEADFRRLGALIRPEYLKRLKNAPAIKAAVETRDQISQQYSFVNKLYADFLVVDTDATKSPVQRNQFVFSRLAGIDKDLQRLGLNMTREDLGFDFARFELDRQEFHDITVRLYNLTLEKWSELGDAQNFLETRRPELVKSLLSEIRPVGGPPQPFVKRTRKVFKDAIERGMELLPSDWVVRSAKDRPMKSLKDPSNRGFHRRFHDVVDGQSISGIATPGNRPSNVLHEITHRMEYIVPRLADMEKEFYDRRTEGLKPEWLGQGYRKDEVAIKDKFVNPYMGKDYGGRVFEIMTEGVEAVYYGTPNLDDNDTDMLDFVLGVLAGL